MTFDPNAGGRAFKGCVRFWQTARVVCCQFAASRPLRGAAEHCAGADVDCRPSSSGSSDPLEGAGGEFPRIVCYVLAPALLPRDAPVSDMEQYDGSEHSRRLADRAGRIPGQIAMPKVRLVGSRRLIVFREAVIERAGASQVWGKW